LSKMLGPEMFWVWDLFWEGKERYLHEHSDIFWDETQM
jgi:hypothetical protein